MDDGDRFDLGVCSRLVSIFSESVGDHLYILQRDAAILIAGYEVQDQR